MPHGDIDRLAGAGEHKIFRLIASSAASGNELVNSVKEAPVQLLCFHFSPSDLYNLSSDNEPSPAYSTAVYH